MRKLFFNSIAIYLCGFAIAQSGALIGFKMTSSKGVTGSIITKHSEFGPKEDMNAPQMLSGSM